MLDRAKTLRALQSVSDTLFADLSPQRHMMHELWVRICEDPLLQQKILTSLVAWPMPSWTENLDIIHKISEMKEPYSVLSVDGSQIFPDRHMGTSCFLLNVGSIQLSYGSVSSVLYDTQPYVFVDRDIDYEQISAQDLVTCKREEFELSTGLEKTLAHVNAEPFLFLYDGSLIFWHLQGKEQILQDYFLKTYCEILQQFYTRKTVVAGYISLPKSKELLNLIRTMLSLFPTKYSILQEQIARFSDTTMCSFFLPPLHRTTIFESHVSIAALYPSHLKPYFFYLHTGDEIARIEIPAYIALDEKALKMLCCIILDQVQKGQGYPVVLAEAHEQAVVKGIDREFFYQAITNLGIDRAQKTTMSQKNSKKRFMRF